MFGRHKHRIDGFGTGCVPNTPDSRDLQLSLDELCYDPAELPEAGGYDLSELVEHLVQGGTPLCVIFAIAHAVQIVEKQAGLPYSPMSKLGPHWYARKMRGNEKKVTGCSIRDIMHVMRKRGAEDEEDWPFSESAARIKKRPDNIACEMSAWKRARGTYKHISTLDFEQRIHTMKATLAAAGKAKRPIVFGAVLGRSFVNAWKAGYNRTIFIDANEDPIGSHAMVVVAYKHIYGGPHSLVLNSWSGQVAIWVPEWCFKTHNVFDLTVYDGWTQLREKLQ